MFGLSPSTHSGSVHKKSVRVSFHVSSPPDVYDIVGLSARPVPGLDQIRLSRLGSMELTCSELIPLLHSQLQVSVSKTPVSIIYGRGSAQTAEILHTTRPGPGRVGNVPYSIFERVLQRDHRPTCWDVPDRRLSKETVMCHFCHASIFSVSTLFEEVALAGCLTSTRFLPSSSRG